MAIEQMYWQPRNVSEKFCFIFKLHCLDLSYRQLANWISFLEWGSRNLKPLIGFLPLGEFQSFYLFPLFVGAYLVFVLKVKKCFSLRVNWHSLHGFLDRAACALRMAGVINSLFWNVACGGMLLIFPLCFFVCLNWFNF